MIRGLLAGALSALAVLIIFAMKIGAVVATITPEHGVHSGDLIGLIALLGAAALAAPRRAVLLPVQ
jgi:hypothetical protein